MGAKLGLAAEKEDRVEPRVRAMVRACMRDNAGMREVCIIDVSTRGLLATTANPPKRGEFVEINVGNNHLAGQVKWSGQRRFGVALQDRVSVAAMIEGGKGKVSLDCAASARPRKQGVFQALVASPDIMGRSIQLMGTLLIIAAAAWFLTDIAGSSLDPVRDAANVMNHGASR